MGDENVLFFLAIRMRVFIPSVHILRCLKQKKKKNKKK